MMSWNPDATAQDHLRNARDDVDLADAFDVRDARQEAMNEPRTRAEQRRRLAASERCAYALIAKTRYPGVKFATERIAASVGFMETFRKR